MFRPPISKPAALPVIRPPPRIGVGLIPQGGISLAMALSMTLTYGALGAAQADAVQLAFTTIVLAVAGSELVGPFLTRDLLREAGEIGPGAESELAAGRG